MTLHWYVIHCEPSHDRQVERLVGSAGVDFFAPRIPKTRRRNGDKPLFPGYVFARLDLASGAWSALRRLPGIRSLVEIGGGPCPVDDGVVAAIQRGIQARTAAAGLPSPGERIIIRSGVFQDLEGIFCEKAGGDERVAVLIRMMRQEVRVEIDLGCLEYSERLATVA